MGVAHELQVREKGIQDNFYIFALSNLVTGGTISRYRKDGSWVSVGEVYLYCLNYLNFYPTCFSVC